MSTVINEPWIAPRQGHGEGLIAWSIEPWRANLASDTFLWVAIGSIAASLTFQIMGRKNVANVIGHWAPTFLIIGLYNQLIKLKSSDGRSAL